MRDSSRAEAERTNHVGLVVLAAIVTALIAAAALGTYEASIAEARAVHDAVASNEHPSAGLQYLPGSSSQMGALREPLMVARRAALRAGFDRDDAPIDAFDRLRTVPGHEDEARTLLAQYWERKAMLADEPVHRVLYALQARVVDDDDSRRRTAASAIAALGPLRSARHVAEGTILWSDARTLVLRGSGWLHVLNRQSDTSFDLSESDSGASLVDGRRMVTWGGETARIWDLDAAAAAPPVPVAAFKLLPGETPLSFAGASPVDPSGASPVAPSGASPAAPAGASPAASWQGCVLTSLGRVWRADANPGEDAPLTVAAGRWTSGTLDPSCDRVVLRGDGLVAYRRRGKTWKPESTKVPRAAGPRGATAKPSAVRIDVCAPRAPRCMLEDAAGVRSLWDFGSSPPRRLFDGVDCEATRFSPDGTRLMCRESQDGVTLYSEDEGGNWTRTDLMLPALTGVFLQDDRTICGSLPARDATASDHADVMCFAAKECWAPPAAEREWGSIRLLPAGTGAVFTYPSTRQGAPGYAEYFGFGSKGESLAAASNAWFGERADERLLERDATNSAGKKSYELSGAPFDPAAAFGDTERVSAVQIDEAFFVESPAPSLVFEVGYTGGGPSSGPPLRAVARWDLTRKRFCGPALPGALTGIAPAGDAVIIDGRIDKLGACAADRGFEPTDVTHAVAVGPGAVRWIASDGPSLQLEDPERDPSSAPPIVPRADRSNESQVAFSRNGARFFVKTVASLCTWMIGDDGALDLDGCRWSAGGWASDASWAASDKTGETVAVFDRTAEGAALRDFFGSSERDMPASAGGDLACNALPKAEDAPLLVLQQWEERLGHRFKDQAPQLQDAREMMSSEIVPIDASAR